MALIVPSKGETRQVAKLLLSLTDDPRDIATTAEGPDGVSFVVPDELHDKYLDALEDVDKAPAEIADEGAPAPKRRGRPPGSKNKPKDVGTEE